MKTDVEAALQVLNFAIYHKELTDMEEREQRELEMKQKADHDAGQNNGDLGGRRWILEQNCFSFNPKPRMDIQRIQGGPYWTTLHKNSLCYSSLECLKYDLY